MCFSLVLQHWCMYWVCKPHLVTFERCTGDLRAQLCHNATKFGMNNLEHIHNGDTKFDVILTIHW